MRIFDNQNCVPAVALVREPQHGCSIDLKPKFFALFAVNSVSFVLFVSFVVSTPPR